MADLRLRMPSFGNIRELHGAPLLLLHAGTSRHMPLHATLPPAQPVCAELDIHRVLTLRLEGAVTDASLDAAIVEISRVAGGARVDGFLIDARESHVAYDMSHLTHTVEQIMDEVAPRRCAVLGTGERSEAFRAIESTARAYAMKAYPFRCEAEARAWLVQS